MEGRGGRDFLVWASGRLACDTAIGVMEIRVPGCHNKQQRSEAARVAWCGAWCCREREGPACYLAHWVLSSPVESGFSIGMTSVGCVSCEGPAASVPAKHLLEGPLHRLPFELVAIGI